jgi:hypothetical protein
MLADIGRYIAGQDDSDMLPGIKSPSTWQHEVAERIARHFLLGCVQ